MISAADNTLRDFILGFIRIHILYHANEGPIYGVWIMEELEKHGYKLTPGTVYPVLHELERGGYLRSYTKIMGGKQRKYYEITSEGKKMLEEVKPKIRELVNEVLQ